MNTHQLTTVTVRATTPIKPKPPCANRPDDWDLDVGTPDIWSEAVRTCRQCPILAQCCELVATLTAHGMPPRSMIWAAIGYDGSGNPIENLDRHRARPIPHKQPLRIVRTGPAYVPASRQRLPDDSCPATPRRTIILRRRRLSPTGTADR
jgi:hypothetical protein